MYETRAIAEPMSLETARAILREITADRRVSSARTIDKPLVLYGGGNLGRMAKDYLDFLGIDVDMVVDVNAERLRQDPFWSGSRLLRPHEVPPAVRAGSLLAVSVANAAFVPVAAELAASGWTDVVPFYDLTEPYRDRHPLSNGWFAHPFTPDDTARIERVLEGWADDMSRAHHLQFLAWRRLRQEWQFADAPVTTGDRFFTPEVLAALPAGARFLDVGTHHGEVAQRLIEARPGFEKIWLIEPDVDSLAQIAKWHAGQAPGVAERIEVHAAAVAGKSGPYLFFGGLGYASQFSHAGPCRIHATTIDRLGFAPTYVKLHLEGWELDAMQGALATLTRHRPVIAATVYHNHLGLWQTPLWLMQALPGYRFFFRLHSWCGTGAVVYGIPDSPAGK